MKGDIGMANYEKQVEQEAAYPIPISLYNFYRTVRHEKRGIAICTPEAVQIKAPRLTIYPVTAQEVPTREHGQWASCISPG